MRTHFKPNQQTLYHTCISLHTTLQDRRKNLHRAMFHSYCEQNSDEKTFEKHINNPIEIQSEVLSQCESCIIYNLSFMIFALLFFQIASSLSPILKVFTSSSFLLFGRSFSFNIRFKVTPSGFKLNKDHNYNKTGPQLCSNYCFIALEKS